MRKKPFNKKTIRLRSVKRGLLARKKVNDKNIKAVNMEIANEIFRIEEGRGIQW